MHCREIEAEAWKVVDIFNNSCITSWLSHKYRLHYPKGGLVKASPGTLGIMCFETKEYAADFVDWMNSHNSYLAGAKIKKVMGFGIPTRPTKIVKMSEEEFDKFYSGHPDYSDPPKSVVPEGTICFEEVVVLD